MFWEQDPGRIAGYDEAADAAISALKHKGTTSMKMEANNSNKWLSIGRQILEPFWQSLIK